MTSILRFTTDVSSLPHGFGAVDVLSERGECGWHWNKKKESACDCTLDNSDPEYEKIWTCRPKSPLKRLACSLLWQQSCLVFLSSACLTSRFLSWTNLSVWIRRSIGGAKSTQHRSSWVHVDTCTRYWMNVFRDRWHFLSLSSSLFSSFCFRQQCMNEQTYQGDTTQFFALPALLA